MEVVMRQKRKLEEHLWYHVRTVINNREPVFQLLEAVMLLCRVLIEAKGKFPFEMRGLVIGNEWLSFYNQARRRVPVAGDYAVDDADVFGAVQCEDGENGTRLGRPVLVRDSGGGAAAGGWKRWTGRG
jgi:hypothetical protein